MKRFLVPFLIFFFTLCVNSSPLLVERSASPLQAESLGEALVPWETPIEGFFIRTHHPVPAIDAARWRLVIDGLVEKPLTLSLADLKKMRALSLHAVLECSGNGRALQKPDVPGLAWERGAVGNAEWSGVALRDILKKAGVKAAARFATIEGADKPAMPGVPPFVRSVPLDKMLDANSLIALKMNREALPLLHGGPARIVLPGWYAENWMKWVTRITLTAEEDPGFYMNKGYRIPKSPIRPFEAWDSATGAAIEEIRVQSLITEPIDKSAVEGGTIRVRGKAFSGAGPIRSVEVSADNGKTWQHSEVEPQRKSGGWQEFAIDVVVDKLGVITLMSRATDVIGNTQPLEHAWNPGGYVRNSVDTIEVNVATTAPTLAARCYTCHAKELITSQRLTSAQWDGVLKKMQGFGVALDDDTHKLVKAELLALSPALPRSNVKTIRYDEVARDLLPVPGNKKRGKSLYQQSCAVCHGTQAQGRIGPRLIRALPWTEFSTAIAKGKGTMPPFGTKFSEQNMRDMHTWLTN